MGATPKSIGNRAHCPYTPYIQTRSMMQRVSIVLIATICYLSLGNTSEFSDKETILESGKLVEEDSSLLVPEEETATAQVAAMVAPELLSPSELEEIEMQTTKGHLQGAIDDPSDKNLRDRNSKGLNKLTGTRHYTSHTLDGNGNVKSPGYTVDQARTGKHGYYLGPSRRRIGAGFGRRRNVPFVIPKSWKESGKKVLSKYKHSGYVIRVTRRRRVKGLKKKLPKKYIRGFKPKKVIVHVKKAFKKLKRHVKKVGMAVPSLHIGKHKHKLVKKILKKVSKKAKKKAKKVKKAAKKAAKKVKKVLLKHIYSGKAGHLHRIVMPHNMRKSKLLKGILKKMKAHKRI